MSVLYEAMHPGGPSLYGCRNLGLGPGFRSWGLGIGFGNWEIAWGFGVTMSICASRAWELARRFWSVLARL